MLVKLFDLPPLSKPRDESVVVRRGLSPEKHIVAAWVEQKFDAGWRSECEVAFYRQPISCFVATCGGTLLGFGCYDTTKRGFFGPTGVDEAARGLGLGKALLLACLHDMYAQGYGYGIIGGVGPVEFYEKVVGATIIAGSTPGIYADLLEA